MIVPIPIGKSQSIRACGYDEYWLHDQIIENPSCLQLGELELISRERQQSSGGRLDLLLKDPEDDSMYEVEVMLGDTDETHIIRTIEYWDNEKRKWPQRQHFAVLVAETITRRYFNVIQLLSHAVPIIAIQVNIVEADGKRLLHFAKILDTYEEPEDEGGTGGRDYNEEFWRQKSTWTLDAAKALLEVVRTPLPGASLNFVKNYIGVEVNGNNYLWLHKRSNARSLLGCWFSESRIADAAAVFDEAGMAYTKKKQELRIAVDKGTIIEKSGAFATIAELIKHSWEE